MDYVELMKAQCPAAVVRYVVEADMAAQGTVPWPNGDKVGMDVSDACHVAALLYRSSVLPSSVGLSISDYLTRDTLFYFDKIPLSDRPVLISALRQLAEQDDLPFRYLFAVTRYQIDVQDALQLRFLTMPEAIKATPGLNPEAFEYLRYLTAMGDETALARLIEALKREPAPSIVSLHIGQIRQLNLPQKDIIFREFINDTRQSLTPNGLPGLVIANTVRRYLGLPRHEGPYTPLDGKGRPFRP